MVEQSHFRTKTAIEQALLLRGGRDLDDESSYLRFARAVVDEERNRPASARLVEERAFLRPLPASRIPEYTTFRCRVRKWSTIRIGNRIYSVPSRLIGHTVEARQHPSTVEILYGDRVLCTMPRLRGAADHRIDYRHIIASLVRKPGAFARYRFREELSRVPNRPRPGRTGSGRRYQRRFDEALAKMFTRRRPPAPPAPTRTAETDVEETVHVGPPAGRRSRRAAPAAGSGDGQCGGRRPAGPTIAEGEPSRT